MWVFLKFILIVSLFGSCVVTATIPRPSSKSTMSPTLYSLNSTVSIFSFDPSRPVAVKIFAVKAKRRNVKTLSALSMSSKLSSPSTSPTYELFYYAAPSSGGGWDNIHRFRPTKEPSLIPTALLPSQSPVNPSKPSTKPTQNAVIPISPSFGPTIKPLPSSKPLLSSAAPSIRQPSVPPYTAIPTNKGPTQIPSPLNSAMLSSRGPTVTPSTMITNMPTSRSPTAMPTTMPSSRGPTQLPSKTTTASPSSRRPTPIPSKMTTMMPSSGAPTAAPSQRPSVISPAEDIQYRGGLVYTGDMKIFNIYYGDFSGNGSQSVALTNYLAANLGNSSWYNILSSYYGIVGGSRVYVHGSLTFVGSYNLFPKWRGNTTTVAAIQQNIVRYILNKNIFQPDPNTILAIIFRGDFSVTSSSGLWLKNWCGLHTGLRLVNDVNFYPILMVGDLSSVTNRQSQLNCSGNAPYPNGNLAADSVASIYAHEVAEVITDPALGQGWNFNPGPGRYPTPWENGDECAWIYPISGNSKVGSKQFSLQEVWQPGGYFHTVGLKYFHVHIIGMYYVRLWLHWHEDLAWLAYHIRSWLHYQKDALINEI